MKNGQTNKVDIAALKSLEVHTYRVNSFWQLKPNSTNVISTKEKNIYPINSASSNSKTEIILIYMDRLGMAIPRRISFLEESRSRGMTNLHSSGIEEYEIYSSGSSGNFEE